MLNVTVLTSIAKSALAVAVVTKLVDTLVSTKINSKTEHERWLRSTKLDLFSKLTEDIVSMDSDNFEHNFKSIKRTSSKIILLINDRNLDYKLEDYLSRLNSLQRNDKIDKNALTLLNKSMISYLQKSIRT